MAAAAGAEGGAAPSSGAAAWGQGPRALRQVRPHAPHLFPLSLFAQKPAPPPPVCNPTAMQGSAPPRLVPTVRQGSGALQPTMPIAVRGGPQAAPVSPSSCCRAVPRPPLRTRASSSTLFTSARVHACVCVCVCVLTRGRRPTWRRATWRFTRARWPLCPPRPTSPRPSAERRQRLAPRVSPRAARLAGVTHRSAGGGACAWRSSSSGGDSLGAAPCTWACVVQQRAALRWPAVILAVGRGGGHPAAVRRGRAADVCVVEALAAIGGDVGRGARSCCGERVWRGCTTTQNLAEPRALLVSALSLSFLSCPVPPPADFAMLWLVARLNRR